MRKENSEDSFATIVDRLKEEERSALIKVDSKSIAGWIKYNILFENGIEIYIGIIASWLVPAFLEKVFPGLAVADLLLIALLIMLISIRLFRNYVLGDYYVFAFEEIIDEAKKLYSAKWEKEHEKSVPENGKCASDETVTCDFDCRIEMKVDNGKRNKARKKKKGKSKH